jgi:hypothetical protein
MEKFEWKATESAPKNFAMKILEGDFVYPDGNSLYVPDGKRIHKGWGNKVSSHIVGERLKLLPKRLDITFFSYTEDEFYRGSFELPYEKILSMFREGHYSPKDRAQGNYSRIMAGVAPGGVVAVWLYGPDKITEVFFGKAKKADIPWTRVLNNSDVTRKEFVQRGVEQTTDPKVLEAINRDGIPYGLWDTYRFRYHWNPVISAARPPKIINEIKFYNGEKDYLFYPLDEVNKNATRAIPKEISIIWKNPQGKPLLLEFYFNEAEIFAAFKQLAPETSAANTQIELEFNLMELDKGKQISVWLRNKDKTIQLKNTKIDTYLAAITDEALEDL